MSKSYRKPYASFCAARTSCHSDKTAASRAFRAAQKQALRSFQGDWDEFLIPERYEASFNDVWGWGRDGIQRLQTITPDTLNPYAYTSYCSPKSWESFIAAHEEDVERQREYIRWLSRK